MTHAQQEAAKYERIWAFHQYRKNAPGEKLVDQAIVDLGMTPGASVIDFGCGTGRPALRLQQAGLHVVAIDHAANCLDEEVRGHVPFRRACLWDLPADLTADYGFCTDVMEHIPEERVTDVLAGIAQATTDGVFFQIATRPDGCGKLIGEKLHLTVQHHEWWRDQLAVHWRDVYTTVQRGGFTAVCR